VPWTPPEQAVTVNRRVTAAGTTGAKRDTSEILCGA